MKREDFKKIIRLRSYWKIDKRRGNYKLPNGDRLSEYVERLVRTQLELDKMGIRNNGNICDCDYPISMADYILHPPYGITELCTYDDMERRIKRLVNEIVG